MLNTTLRHARTGYPTQQAAVLLLGLLTHLALMASPLHAAAIHVGDGAPVHASMDAAAHLEAVAMGGDPASDHCAPEWAPVAERSGRGPLATVPAQPGSSLTAPASPLPNRCALAPGGSADDIQALLQVFRL